LRETAERARAAGRPEAAARLADVVFELIESSDSEDGAHSGRRVA
jgi:hypothetical protein